MTIPFFVVYHKILADTVDFCRKKNGCSYTVAAEQKARLTYDNILRLSDDPDVTDAIRFLRAREIVHFQRFGEGLRLAKDRMNEKNVYYMNPSFDQ